MKPFYMPTNPSILCGCNIVDRCGGSIIDKFPFYLIRRVVCCVYALLRHDGKVVRQELFSKSRDSKLLLNILRTKIKKKEQKNQLHEIQD